VYSPHRRQTSQKPLERRGKSKGATRLDGSIREIKIGASPHKNRTAYKPRMNHFASSPFFSYTVFERAISFDAKRWQSRMNARQGDIIVGLSSLALVAYVFVATTDMPAGPAGFPRLIALGLLICGLILIARSFLKKGDSELLFADIHWPVIATIGLAWIAAVIAVSSLGFLIPGSVFIAAVAWILMGRPRAAAPILRIGLFTVGMTIALWIIFHQLLGVESAAGPDTLLF
jgi:hypothetical protein